MGLQNWRWWQWLLASLLIGAAVGFALTRLDPDDPSIPSTSFAMMRAKLERRTETGASILTDIRVSPVIMDHTDKPVQSVTFWERQRHKGTGRWDPTMQFRTVTPVPLSKLSPRADFGVLDYLAERKKEIPSLDYRFQWWLVPRNVWLMSIGGSVLLVGLIWPVVLKLMIKLGLAEPPAERGADLSGVRTTDSSTAMRSGSIVTADDRQKLAALNAELEANVAGMSVGVAADSPDRPAAAVAPVQLPTERPAEPSVPAVTPGKPEDFEGEFYPVARPIVKKT
ncbi:MAG TPA: hypothetical protein VF595_04145 [Tepidisphaeraceae bacterium]|jgi:hypothetical protein